MRRPLTVLLLLLAVFGFSFSVCSKAEAAASYSGVTVVKTGVSGAYTFIQVNIPSGASGVYYTLPTGSTGNSMLATALSALSSSKTIRLDLNSTAAWSVVNGVWMESTSSQ